MPFKPLDRTVEDDMNRQDYYVYIPLPTTPSWGPPTANAHGRSLHVHGQDVTCSRYAISRNIYGYFATEFTRNESRNQRGERDIISGFPLKRLGWSHAIQEMQSVAGQLDGMGNIGINDDKVHLRVAKDLRDVVKWLNQLERGVGKVHQWPKKR